VKLLAVRPRTEAELRDRLAADGFPAEEIEEVLAWGRASGYLDDGALSERWIETRAARKGRGRSRLVSELVRRGVARDVAEEAWNRAVDDGGVDPEAVLARAVEKKVAAVGGRLDDRRYARVYNALLRAGFDASAVRAALTPHRPSRRDDEDEAAERTDHDLP
jgi:regulatory protein